MIVSIAAVSRSIARMMNPILGFARSSELFSCKVNSSLLKSFPKIAAGPARHAASHDENSHGPHEHVNEDEGSTRSTFKLLQEGSGIRSSQSNSSQLFALPRLNWQFTRRLHHQARQKSTFTVAKDSSIPTPPEVPAAAMRDPNASPEDNQTFTYLMVGGAGVAGAMAAKSTVMNFLSTLSASGDVLAMAQVEMDLSSIPEGKSVVIKWRGKPIFIRHRTPAEIEAARNVDISHLRDPQADADRVQRPEWLVMLGICTHLGCVPTSDAGDYGGWYCPCHGSHYDISGRIRKGPAPLNLEIPEYTFVDDNTIVIG